MAYTAAQLQSLRDAIAEGVLQVRFSDGRQMTYRSLDEMRRIERSMSLEVEGNNRLPIRRVYYGMSRPT
jgi:hypothetical protein